MPGWSWSFRLVEINDHGDGVAVRAGLETDLVHEVLDEKDAPAARVRLALDAAFDVGRADFADAGATVLHGDLQAILVDREPHAEARSGMELVAVLDGVHAGFRHGGF